MGKKTIYVLTEATRYEEDTWLLGVPSGYDVSYERFNFDTKYGDLNIDDVEDDIRRLEELDKKFAGAGFQAMIKDRRDWVANELKIEREREDDAVQARARHLEEARQLLRQAGELPEPNHGHDCAVPDCTRPGHKP